MKVTVYIIKSFYVRLEPIMLKIYLPELPKNFTYYSYHHLLFLYYSFNFTGSVKIMSKMYIKLFRYLAAS